MRNVEAAIRGQTIGLFGGMLSRLFAFNTGVQFMGYYVAVLSVPAIARLFRRSGAGGRGCRAAAPKRRFLAIFESPCVVFADRYVGIQSLQMVRI
ncbi:hypothetical protein [Burkholderia sp. BCC0419]|uniref:hypothetical protein n=1 Tax=Burkholderia sp. BCC0419 TaxID=486878 RepID=UPI00158EC0D4|nr:hypothetical protein [Burkholderia sp. BCC0419]